MASKSKFLTFLGFSVACLACAAQQECQYFGEKAAKSLEAELRHAPSCAAAVKRLHDCQWGSNADLVFASIVIEKCERGLLPKLSQTERKRYLEEKRLCVYEYANQEGSLSHSENVVCQADVAAEFAANPSLARQPMPRASFDCKREQSPLEKAICSDRQLGNADIVLNRVYKAVKNSMTQAQQSAFAKQQMEWMARAIKKCSVTSEQLSPSGIGCMRGEFEDRFADLDGCSVGGPEECLNATQPNAQYRGPSPTGR
jgi:uncharacterized protein YecT (DUF1311 family)